jgi:hypothetical protein
LRDCSVACKVAWLLRCKVAQCWKLAPPSGLPSNWTKDGTAAAPPPTTKWSLEPAEHSVLAAKKYKLMGRNGLGGRMAGENCTSKKLFQKIILHLLLIHLWFLINVFFFFFEDFFLNNKKKLKNFLEKK